MPNLDESIERFCNEITNYLSHERQSSPELSLEPSGEVSPHTLTEVKKTQIKVSEEIGGLLERKTEEERLLNLYALDSTLYKLRHEIDQKERHFLKNLCDSIEKALEIHIEGLKKKRQEADERLLKRAKWNNRIRVLCYIVGFVCAFLGFADPDNVGIYLSITLLCLTQIFLLGDFWINVAKSHKEKVNRNNDPEICLGSLKFLSEDHLALLLEPPCYDPAYQKRFVQMIVQLAFSYQWVPNEEVMKDNLMENSRAALDGAYSAQPNAFDPAFIKKWRLSYEEIQTELHQHFGGSVYQFTIKNQNNPLFYLERYSQIKTSELGKKIQNFLKKTKYL